MGLSAMLGVGGLLASIGGGVAAGLSSKTTVPTPNSTAAPLDAANSTYLQNILTDPQAGMGPIAAAGTQAIDSSYAGSADTITRMMASRGYGSSGNMGNTMYQTDLSRLSSLSQFGGQMAQLESNRQMQASGDINQLIGMNTGTVTNTPGAGLAQGLLSAGNGMGNISSSLGIMSMLQAMIAGNGNGNNGYGGVGGNGVTPSGTPSFTNSLPGYNGPGPTMGTSENGGE